MREILCERLEVLHSTAPYSSLLKASEDYRKGPIPGLAVAVFFLVLTTVFIFP